jgi:hypothetical protein
MNLSSLHRIPATGAVLACMLLGGLLFGDTPALAVLRYPLVREISAQGEYPEGVGFDDVSGDVVLSRRSGLEAFGSSGEQEWFGGTGSDSVAVNEGTGEIYSGSDVGIEVLNSAGAYQFEINTEGAGKPVPKGLIEVEAVGVDQATGDVYAYSRGNEAIDVFTATGEYLFQITSANGNKFGRFVRGLAVDGSTGALLIGEEFEDGENSVVYVLDAATGAYVTTWNGANTPQKSFSGRLLFGVNSATGDVYVATPGLNEQGKESYPAVVDRFTATGEYENQILGVPGEVFGRGSLYSVAVNSVSGDVYALRDCQYAECLNSKNQGVVDVFAGTPVAAPRVSLAPSSSLKSTSVTLHGLVYPEETGETSCEFEFGISRAYGQRVPCSALVADGNTAAPVEAQLSGLKSDTTYYYRLDAKNVADGYTNLGEGSEDLGQLTTPGPKFVGEGVSAVTTESASFAATVVPNGLPSSAYFQYGTSEAYGASAPASPGVALGAGTSEVEFARHVQGLQAATTYHYRLVVLSELGTGRVEEVDGPDHTFTTQSVAAGFTLPDGRVWEMVTPAEKEGALFFSQNYGMTDLSGVDPLVGEASVNGNAMVDLASIPTEADPAGYVNEVSVLSTRGPDGWSSRVIAPPHKYATTPSSDRGGEFEFFSEDLSRAVVDPFGRFTALSPEASEPTPYLYSDYLDGDVSHPCESSCYAPLVTTANTRSGVQFGKEDELDEGCKYVCGPQVVDATPDTSFLALKSIEQLTSTPNESVGDRSYYEWGGGELQPLYLLPESEGGRGVNAGMLSSVAQQFSEEGSVFFTYNEHLYLHDFAKDGSVRLDVAQGVVEPAAGGAGFLYASSDGSTVLFSDSKQLTGAGKKGIYECRIVETAGLPVCDLKLTSISGGTLIGDTLIGGSKDASYLYFEDATGHLVVDHYNDGEWTATSGPFLGSLSKSLINPGIGDTAPLSKISPNGRWLTFMSDEELTGYDNHDAVNGRPDVEVYLYDALSNRLVCASCNPTGARPVGAEYNKRDLVAGSLTEGTWEAANLPPWTTANYFESRYQPRFLSDSGRLFFDSRDALVPQDVDGTQDVYEWEPPGVGDCTTASPGFSEGSGGCVRLISSGASAEESAFMDASESGGDVFFITLAKLTPQDFDNALDVYDAHECTAQSPCVAPPPVAPPACATGDACKAAPTPQPSIFGAPSSATFSGAGNVSPPESPSVAKGPKRKQLSRSQKLAQALKACAKKRRALRAGCVRGARKRYGKTASHRSVSARVNHGKRG